MKDLYQAELLDHFKHPRNYGSIENAEISSEEYNPSCGDSIQLFLVLEDDKIVQVNFVGKGCVISQAAASMFTEKIKNMNLDEAKKISVEFMKELVGIDLGPNRLQCATLPLIALQKVN